jgi:histone deacetylase 6
MTHMLKSLAGGKVVAVLEGGYNLESIAKSAVAVTKTLMGEPPDRIRDVEPCFAGIATVKMVIAEHSKYWKCLYPKDRARERMESMGGKRLDEVLRRQQVYEWSEKYGMGPIHIWDADGYSPNDRQYALAS